MFKPVSAKVNFPEIEEEILRFWKKNKIFEKSVEQRPKDKEFVFYDGPPFVTGLPHYGTLLSSIAKDVIPRYQTMKGNRVKRVWGWDCHGLPIENKVEKKIGLENRREILKFGINEFIEECKKYVEKTSPEWKWYVDHVGRWVDFDNAYRTMDLNYMETVIWVFKQVFDKGLVYQGLKTLLYCTRCGTPVSKFEIAMDDSYAMMQDPAVTIKFRLKEGKFRDSFILAWTTTPWTLPSNRALVVDENEKYVKVKTEEEKESLILAKKRLELTLQQRKFKVLQEFEGKQLLGLSYEPLYTFFPANKKDFKVYHYKGMVNMEEGTGVVHSAPGFGEIDTEIGRHYGLTLMFAVDDEGKFVNQVKKWAGVHVKDADEKIVKDLEERSLLFDSQIITHRYPYCYRCETPLIYKTVKAWFVEIQKIKKKMLSLNKNINWVPVHFKEGRFDYTIREAPDWCVSRTRYWATVMPIWKCQKCKNLKVAGSVKEIEKLSGEKVTDLHRTGVDHLVFKCENCGGTMKRIPEVLDCWFESGSMPYAQRHYPFENKERFESTFPADFIVEYTGQLRAWFYYLHALSTALFKSHSFKNVVVTGVLAGTDGRKMSKSYGNYPDPKDVLQKYGGDALRLYLMGSVIMLGRDMNITGGEEIKDQIKTVLLPLWNSYKYFVTFANLNSWSAGQQVSRKNYSVASLSSCQAVKLNILDRWIISRLNQFNQSFTKFMDVYQIVPATQLIRGFVDDLSRWYIRRSRDRFVKGDKETLQTLYSVLVQFCLVTAPIIPFTTEEIFKNLTSKESVHLQDWPKAGKIDQKLLEEMETVRKICELGHAERKRLKIKVRQPLAEITVTASPDVIAHFSARSEKDNGGLEAIRLIKDELNIKKVKFVEGEKLEVVLNVRLTPALKAEGEARELVREIQALRKKRGCRLDEKIVVTAPSWTKEFEDYIKQKTMALKIRKGKRLAIEF